MFFFFNDTATTEIYTLSLHDALPISPPFGVVVSGGADPRPHARRPDGISGRRHSADAGTDPGAGWRAAACPAPRTGGRGCSDSPPARDPLRVPSGTPRAPLRTSPDPRATRPG